MTARPTSFDRVRLAPFTAKKISSEFKRQTIKMYTTGYCADCRRAKWFLNHHQLPFEEINIEEVPGAEEFVISANQGKRKVPTFEVGGRTFHCSPYDPEKLHRELGLAGL
jgi:mycoredoxin